MSTTLSSKTLLLTAHGIVSWSGFSCVEEYSHTKILVIYLSCRTVLFLSVFTARRTVRSIATRGWLCIDQHEARQGDDGCLSKYRQDASRRGAEASTVKLFLDEGAERGAGDAR